MALATTTASASGIPAAFKLRPIRPASSSAKLFALASTITQAKLEQAFAGPLSQLHIKSGLSYYLSGFRGAYVPERQTYECSFHLNLKEPVGKNCPLIEDDQSREMTKTALAASIDFVMDHDVLVKATPLITRAALPAGRESPHTIISEYKITFVFSEYV